jgi:predicted SAM-dependent methyltransferase
MELINFNNREYPKLQSQGFASQYSFKFAEKICKGKGYDIGCNRPEWSLDGSIPVDPELNQYDALNLPKELVDYIYSSHCLEHLPDYVKALDYWSENLKQGGILFMYLPNMDYQEYWNPANNRKHYHYFTPKIIQSYFDNRKDMWEKVIVTKGYDLNGSFYAVSKKK